jgi:hypothetical protein
MRLRARLITSLISKARFPSHHAVGDGPSAFDAVICESQLDSAIMLHDLGAATKIYNCATPLADELRFGGMLTNRGYRRIKDLEVEIFKASHHLSFHWHSYADYVRKYYNYDTPNIFIFDRIAAVTRSPAKFDLPPRVAYIGALGGYWINPQLLSELTRRYSHIDVYGLPKPPRKLGLNYKGYASADVL